MVSVNFVSIFTVFYLSFNILCNFGPKVHSMPFFLFYHILGLWYAYMYSSVMYDQFCHIELCLFDDNHLLSMPIDLTTIWTFHLMYSLSEDYRLSYFTFSWPKTVNLFIYQFSDLCFIGIYESDDFIVSMDDQMNYKYFLHLEILYYGN